MPVEALGAEEQCTRMIFGKLRQVVTQKFGYGIKENRAFKVAISTMSAKDLERIIRNGALYHIKRIYRQFFARGETVVVRVSEGLLKGRRLVGSALCPWALNEDNPYDAAFKLGRAFGLETKDPKVLVDFLRKISACVLTKKQSVAVSETNKRECLPFPFLPCIEQPSPNAFLTEHPLKILEKNAIASDVPYITGINEMEGVILLKPVVDKLPPIQVIEKDFERLVPRFLGLKHGTEKSKEVASKIRQFYFKNRKFDKKTYREYCDLITDTYFLQGMHTTTRLHSKWCKSPVYNYYFVFEGDFGLLKKIINLKSIPGPVHADDLGYLFHIPVIGPNTDPKTREMKFSKKIVRLWTNFAKHRNPTPFPADPVLHDLIWKPFSEENSDCLIMGDHFQWVAGLIRLMRIFLRFIMTPRIV
ncbi:Bile salt-activated lipase precursor, putative [Pediculus humanus corporis]|uniref:Bile salt-activated lipase, putative n=1 Tax=Pediculus humanus subsp. corporis TaxID=121224 RepID=E0VVK3_PEDHC|nr:Bile salt-activated lipase precursor, putative [Pediculus humanus corporis]EEB17409.1 Bile salt-activated lipase precursor, putative [Pediculus humanus corporis]